MTDDRPTLDGKRERERLVAAGLLRPGQARPRSASRTERLCSRKGQARPFVGQTAQLPGSRVMRAETHKHGGRQPALSSRVTCSIARCVTTSGCLSNPYGATGLAP